MENHQSPLSRFFNRRTILTIILLTLGWYIVMFIPEITRSVLFNGADYDSDLPRQSSPFILNSVLFLLVTGGFLAIYFRLAPAVKNRFLAVLFCLPWAPAGAAVYIFILNLTPGVIQDLPDKIGDVEYWTSIFVIVPIAMVATAWVPMLIMKPITMYWCLRINREFREDEERKLDQIWGDKTPEIQPVASS